MQSSSSPVCNAQLGQCLIWPGCQQRQIWQCGEYDTRQTAVHHVMNKNLISLCNYIIIPYKMFPMNILLNYTNVNFVKHNVIVLCYLPPPVMSCSCLVISYFPDGVFSITCITFGWTTKRVPRLRQPAPGAERNNISHLYSSEEYTTEH
jgi:hypothetical protein